MDKFSPHRLRQVASSLFALFFATLFISCAGGSRSRQEGGYGQLETAFIRSPFLAEVCSVFLTNAPSFSAHLTLETSLGTDGARLQSVSGTLLAAENHFLFVPEKASSGGKRDRGGMGLIWNLPGTNGFVLNEALQGYSPFTNAILVTNVSSSSGIGSTASEKINGHGCRIVSAQAFMSDGANASFTAWLAEDLKSFPLRVKSVTGTAQTTLNLSDLRFENIDLELFSPPDGFAPYPSAQAMTDELMRRQNRVGSKNSRGDFDDANSWTPHERGRRY